MGCMKEKFPSSLLDAAMTLINTCDNEFLERLPGKVSRRFLSLAKEMWISYSNQKGCVSASKHDLAETIFRLSMNQINHTAYMPELIKRSMFGNDQSDFEDFILNYWENSPVLLRNTSRNESVIFNCFDFSSRSIDATIDSILQGLISCPPIVADELDILTFLEEVKGVLGSPMVYGQDIRVVKTQELLSGSTSENVKEEVHFNCTSLTSVGGSAFTCNYVQNCKEAVQDGYTIALRGLEFRSKQTAGLSDGLAALFGQPSVGANVYLTPPNSQGLSRHYDDHCVFVYQLLGMKKWVVFPQSTPLLPRLYEPLDSLPCLQFAGNFGEGREFFLHEGDILYIPRGCPHEAYTATTNEGESQIDGSTFSLHLTLGIEVEPPFEWEGFAHVALDCWSQKQTEDYCLIDSTPRIPNSMIINLLHIAIRLIGEQHPAFRKACMVASSVQSDDGRVDDIQNLTVMQRSIFCNIIDSIDAQSNFVEAFEKIEAAVHKKNDVSMQWFRWLRHLPQEGNKIKKFDFNNLLQAFEEFLLLSQGHIKAVETIFMQVKCQFCRSITFEDTRKSFEDLLKKYKKTRRQYMNGMVLLHSAS